MVAGKAVSDIRGPEFNPDPDAGRYARGAEDPRRTFRVSAALDAWKYFDRLTNCVLVPRKSDTGFLDQNQYMVAPRPGTRTVGDVVSETGRTDDLLFYTSAADSARAPYMTAGGKLYKLVSDVWEDTGVALAAGSAKLSVVQLPYNASVTPTEYDSLSSTTANYLKPSASDTAGAGNIGKYLFVTGSTSSSNSPERLFRFYISRIQSYDGTLGYGMSDFAATIPCPAGLKYQVFDGMKELLQVANGENADRYWDGDAEVTRYAGAASWGLNLAIASPYCGQFVSYAGHYFVSSGSVVIGSTLTNPFIFEISNSCHTVDRSAVTGLFQFKSYLIVGAEGYVGYLQASLQAGGSPFELTDISSRFGVMAGGVADMGGAELHYLSGNSELYSLQQTFNSLTQSYTYLMVPKNVGQAQANFLNAFKVNACAGFDGRRLYVYGEPSVEEAGVTLVYDLNVGWWYDWTGIRPTKIVTEGGTTYFSEGGRQAVSRFDASVFKDRYDGADGDDIQQACRTKNNVLGDVFRTKGVEDVFFWFDDYDQKVNVKVRASTVRANGTLVSKDLDVLSSGSPEVSYGTESGNVIGEDAFQEEEFGSVTALPGESFPNLWKIQLQNHNEFHSFRVEVAGRSGSPFYLNEIAFRAGLSNGDAFPQEYCK